MEYNFSILPDDVQCAIRQRDNNAHFLAAQEQELVANQQLMETRSVMSLNARHRVVMEKRSEVLLAVGGYMTRNGLTKSKAIAAFVRAQSEWADCKAAYATRDAGTLLSGSTRHHLEVVPMLTSDDGFALTEEVLKIANDRSDGKSNISRRTLYRWFAAKSEGGIQGLAPAQTKAAEPVPEGFIDFLRFYASPAKPDATEALKEYNKTNPPPEKCLSIHQVRRTLKVKLNDIERNVGREGLLTLRSRMAYITRTTEGLWPTTVYTADGKTFDAEVADWKTHRPMKPEITSILDVATKKCVGIAISRKENTIAVTEALRVACVDHGIPAIFYTDRGAGYKNKTMDGDVGGLMGRLSITKMHALPYNSQAKGLIERLNRTAWNPLAEKLPTYLGKKMDKEAAALIHKQTRSDIAQFGQSRLLPTWAEFREMCDKAVVEYNENPHSSLPKIADPETGKMRHMSPNEAWEAHVAEGFEAIPVDDHEIDDLFRPYEVRTARRALVEWNSNTYFHEALEAYNGEKVMVGYDDTQARYVWVREVDRKSGQPGKFICKADFTANKERYVPLTAQRAAEERRAKGRMRRLDNKVQDIAAELGDAAMLEHLIEVPLEQSDQSAGLRLVDNVATPRAPVSSEPPADPDLEFAKNALLSPEKLGPRQIIYLRKLITSNATREWFRMSGIDVAGLEAIVRAAA